MFTPHARGSTAELRKAELLLQVYPACAGIDRGRSRVIGRPASLPRMRGDRPLNGAITPTVSLFTPHARGSTQGGAGRGY